SAFIEAPQASHVRLSDSVDIPGRALLWGSSSSCSFSCSAVAAFLAWFIVLPVDVSSCTTPGPPSPGATIEAVGEAHKQQLLHQPQTPSHRPNRQPQVGQQAPPGRMPSTERTSISAQDFGNANLFRRATSTRLARLASVRLEGSAAKAWNSSNVQTRPSSDAGVDT